MDVRSLLRSDVHGPQPFSPWLCISAPHLASDESSGVAPYAVLDICIDRANGLPAADITGFSDPYVNAQLNDIDLPEVRTKTQKQTLAPKWEESFHIRIFRPGSVLTLYVHDEDFGEESTVGFAGSFIGLSDDLLGYVDISIERLPLNEKVSGWFTLMDPRHGQRLLNYKSRTANLEKGIKPPAVGRIRLQLTLHVAQPQHELFALCLGPPAFAEPLQPLSLAKLFGDISSISHFIEDTGSFLSPVMLKAERCSSFLFGTLTLLVWRPEFILPLVSLAASAVLLASAPEKASAEPEGESEGEGIGRETEDAEASKPGGITDPGLMKVFAAAETSLPAHQYSEFSTVQGNVHNVLEVVEQFEAMKALALAHRRWASVALLVLTFILAYFRHWQGLFIRLLLTAGCLSLLAHHSCAARILRAFKVFNDTKKPLREFQPHGPQGSTVETKGLRRRATTYLTPDAVASLINSPTASPTNGAEDKPMHHRLQEGSWAEPKWCQHCGGFLWGVWRQGWQCSHCSTILCHACAREADLDFCVRPTK